MICAGSVNDRRRLGKRPAAHDKVAAAGGLVFPAHLVSLQANAALKNGPGNNDRTTRKHGSHRMNGVRIGIIASLLLCVWLAWPKGETSAPPRPLLIKSALKDAKDPIIVLGDSIVRQTLLPRTLCKRPVINAGIDGSTTSSSLDGMLKKAIGDKKAAMIVVSLGMNDAETADSVERYRTNYAALLTGLKLISPRLALVALTGLEAGKPEVGHRTPQIIDSYNVALTDIARDAGASVIAMPPMPPGFTSDGVHLSASGTAIWSKAISDGITATLCPNG
jgi:lysophospholipase L1-like esterase